VSDEDDPLATVMFGGLTVEGGRAALTTTQRHEDGKGVLAAMAVAMIDVYGDAENYAEFSIKPAGNPNEYVLTVTKRHGKTPHDLRLEAEAEVERLTALVDELRGVQ
jgi:hypothetical protein